MGKKGRRTTGRQSSGRILGGLRRSTALLQGASFPKRKIAPRILPFSNRGRRFAFEMLYSQGKCQDPDFRKNSPISQENVSLLQNANATFEGLLVKVSIAKRSGALIDRTRWSDMLGLICFDFLDYPFVDILAH